MTKNDKKIAIRIICFPMRRYKILSLKSCYCIDSG